MSTENLLTHPLTPIEITGREIENIFLSFMLCVHNAPKFS